MSDKTEPTQFFEIKPEDIVKMKIGEVIKFSGVLMKADMPAISGRIYPKEALEKVAEDIKNKPVPLTVDPTDINCIKAVGFVNSAEVVDETTLVCSGEAGEILKEADKRSLYLTPMGVGEIVNGVVDAKSYRISGVTISPINGWEDQTTAETEDSPEGE